MRKAARERPTAATPELIQRASTGSLRDLSLLVDKIKSEQYPIEVLKVVFKFLHPELVPSVKCNWSDFRQPLERAVDCMALLICALLQPESASPLKAALVDQLIENVEGLCRWIYFLLLIPDNAKQLPGRKLGGILDAYRNSAALIHEVLSLDDRVYDAYISSPKCIDIIVRLWFRIDDNSGEPLLDITSRSILYAFHAVFTKEDGLEIFLSRIIEKGLVPRLAWTILRRARLASEDPSATDSPAHAIEYLRILSGIFSRLMVSSSEDLHRGFGDVNYLREFCSAINTLSITVQKGHATMLPRLGRCVHVLFCMAADARTHIVGNWESLFEGGIIPLLTHLMPWAPKSTELASNFADLSTMSLLSGLSHPRVISRFLGMYPDGKVPSLKGCGLATNERWEFRWKQVMSFCEAYQKFGGMVVTICDNLACVRREERLMQRTPSQQCASCSSVVYCSTACQEEDWKAFHSRECRQARHDHAVRRSLGTWYSHSVRQFHVQLVADAITGFECEPGEGALLMLGGNPDTTGQLYCSQGEMASAIGIIRTVPLEYLWSSRAVIAFPPEFLKPRHASVFQRYLSGLASPKSKVVVVVFYFGKHSFLELTVLLEPVGGVYQGVYSIARHG
ncbi:hypothetical protein DFP72DRAFT_882799 [Ephemerocybe angulata]|uniref:MYND-type domain-containing protein n=1 Tax=Ephemerocybe angulata TaxID=980116 RepID=A0A8H6M996_9AGAR|nr:hypothetical protein DFP72DRAFT_882799 [Tulosesus angulatus]